MPLRSIQKENEQMKNDHFLCLNCRLLQSYPQDSSWNIAVPNEEDVSPQKHFQRRIRSPDNVGQWEEDSQATQLEDYSKLNQDLSSAPNITEESKEHCVRAALESHRSRWNDQCESLERSKNISPQLDNFLICKYIDGDKYHNHPTEKKQNSGKNFKLEKEQSALESGGTGDCCMSDDEMPLPSAVKRPYQPKSVSFYVPNLGTAKRADVTMSSSSEVKAPKKSDSEGKDKERESSPFSACPGEKENEFNEKHKIKAKNQDSLMVKLNLHPFQKARIHPAQENTEQNQSGQHRTLTESCQKLLHTSKKEAIKRKRKAKPELSVAPQETLDNSKKVVSSRSSVNKLPEENSNNTSKCISFPSKNNPAIRITEGTSPASHLQDSPSPNGTSRMTVSVTAVSSDNSIAQNTVTDIPTILVSSKALKENATATSLLSFHQKSLMTSTKLQMPDGLTGTNHMEKYGPKRADENPDSNDGLSRTFVPDALIASLVLKEESVQTGEEWAHNESKIFKKSMVKVSVLSNISSASSNPEMENMGLDRNISFEMKNDVHMNESDMQEVPNNQSDEGSREHKDDKMPPQPSLLSGCKVVSYGEEAESSLIPCSTNKAEVSVVKPTLSPTSDDYDKKSPLQMDQSKTSFSNNNYPSLFCYKDKKPFSI
ncbi:UNVERIFIED_CONTAM: hypothetical protein K2H54_047656 [Gekko kuhli]